MCRSLLFRSAENPSGFGPTDYHTPSKDTKIEHFLSNWNVTHRLCRLSRIDTWLAPEYNNTAYFRACVHEVDRCLLDTHPYNPSRLWDAVQSDASYDDISNAFSVHTASYGLSQ